MVGQFGSLEDIYEYKSRIYANPETIRQLGEYLSKVGGKLTGSIEIVDSNDKQIAIIDSNGFKLTGGSIEVLDVNSNQIALLNDTGFKVSNPSGTSFVSMEPTAGAASVFLLPNDPAANSGEIFATDNLGILFTVIDSPFFDTQQLGRIQLSGADTTGAIRPQLRLLSLDGVTFDEVPGNISVSISGDLEIIDGGTITRNGASIPHVRAGKVIMTFSGSDTALATIDYGFTFPAPPAVTATLSGGGIDQFALRMGTVGTGSVALRANTHDSAAITGDFEVNWVAIAVT